MEIDTNIVDEHASSILNGLKTRKVGRLIVFEGIDGTGKTTQLNGIKKWCDNQGYPVIVSSWRGSTPIGKYLENIQAKGVDLVPEAFSLTNASDLAYRVENEINPGLSAGKIVLCDRYYFTGIARDSALGLDKDWVKNRYVFAPEPDLVLYFDAPPDVALDRLIKRATKVKGTVAGTVAGITRGTIIGTIGGQIGVFENEKGAVDLQTIFKDKKKEKEYYDFIGRVKSAYKEMVKEYGMKVINAAKPIPPIRNDVIEHVSALISSWK